MNKSNILNKFKMVDVGENVFAWDSLVKSSKQGTIFSTYKYLEAAGRKHEQLFIYKGNEIKAGISVIKDDSGRKCELDDLVIYNGIIFRNDALQKKVKARGERFEIVEFVIQELSRRYNNVEMALHPSFEDMRPFLWHRYHDEDQSLRCKLDLRYTSTIDISEFFLRRDETEMDLFESLDNSRQSDIRKARNEGISVREDATACDVFIKYYLELMGGHVGSGDNEKITRMKVLLDLLIEAGIAKAFVAKNNNGQITYISIFTLFQNRACYLFGAGDAFSMTRYDGTICIWDAFKILANYGICEVDMEGINSPQRGAFKLSFGGNIQPYYHVSWIGDDRQIQIS